LTIVKWKDGERRLNKRLFGGGLNNFSETYIDFGHDYEKVEDYSRDLDLRTAVSTVSYAYNGVKYSREYFVSYPDKAIVIHLSASGEGNLGFTLRPTIPYKQEYMVEKGDRYSKCGRVVACDDQTITLSGNLGYNNVDFAAKYKVVNSGGAVTFSNGTDAQGNKDNGTVTVSGANSAYIVITLSTNFELSSTVYTESEPEKKLKNTKTNALETAESELASALLYTYPQLRERHVADYESLFGRVDVDFGGTVPLVTTDVLLSNYKSGKYDTYLDELYFQFGRYLLISSSRKGSVPPNLQGTWNRYNLAPWGSGYWHNINIQMNYSHAFSTNLAETFGAYIDFWRAFLPKAEQYATSALLGEKYESNLGLDLPYNEEASKKYLKNIGKDGGNGWTIGIGSQLFDISTFPGCGNVGFTTQMFWDYYDYTRDTKVLGDVVYPALKGASLYITKTFEKEKDGTYLSIWGDSPEQHVDGVWYYTKGTTYDQSFAYSNGYNTLKAAEILGIKSSDRGESVLATVKEQLPSYDPIAVGYSGQVKEFREENYYGDLGEYAHRHVSQLVGLYPGNIINSETPAWIDAAKYTLSQREKGSAGDEWGWSIAHRQSLWARVGDGNEAYRQYRKLLTKRTLTNLWAKTPAGFQIDGNFGGAAGVSEMLLQSHSGYIEPLAALPDEWSSGSYSGLVARGNFELGARWENGKATLFSIKSKSGGTCRLKYSGLEGALVEKSDGTAVSFTSVAENVISFDTCAGETYIVRNFKVADKIDAPSEFCIEKTGRHKYRFSWKRSADAVKYNIYKAVENDSTYTLVGETAEAIYTHQQDVGEQNKRVTYCICAVSDSGVRSDRILAYVNP